MIPVKMQPAPSHFIEKVQKPGEKFLKKAADPTRQWKHHEYWREILEDLYHLYNHTCSYSCHWIPPDTGAKTVEHFKPKKLYPQEAYCWENYRLVCNTLNGRKGDNEDVLDPFIVQAGWFVLDFPLLEVRPGDGLSASITEQVQKTIDRLNLNDEGTCLQARVSWLRDYIQVPFPFSHLEEKAPFLAFELKRQDLIEKIREIMIF